MAKEKRHSINGKDTSGNDSFIMVTKEEGKIHIFSPEDGSSVVFTKQEARQLIKLIEDTIKE